VRIFKRVPDLVEEFTERITSLLKDRSHGVLITGVQLMIEVGGRVVWFSEAPPAAMLVFCGAEG
jgi:hypothetical protein